MSKPGELEAALARAHALVDERFGVVRQIVVHDVGPSDPPLFFSTAQLASTGPFSDAIASTLNGGAGISRAVAMMGALGEAIERYSIGMYREAETIRAPFREVEPIAIDPLRLIFFADAQYEWPQFPYVRFDPASPLSWVAGVSLMDGGERLVPAARVYTPYRAPRAEERLLQSTSTGAACHVDRDRALLSGLYECIERDAVMIAWLNRLPLSGIDPWAIENAELASALECCARVGCSVRMFDATTDIGIPTVLCVLLNPPGTVPSLAIGAATRSTTGAAAAKALVESAHTLFWVHTRCREAGLRRFRPDYSDVVSLDMHSLLYGDPRMREKMTFLLRDAPGSAGPAAEVAAARPPSSSDDAVGELHRCLLVLRRLGLEAVVVDVTPADIADLGFVVVRIVVADLHPLWGGHHVRCLGGNRVAQVPLTLGHCTRPRMPSELNTDPHPMP
jgi:ribosomal protein S12 methylthiotransferase accessory factor